VPAPSLDLAKTLSKSEETHSGSILVTAHRVNTVVGMLQKSLDLVRLDFAPRHEQPSGARLALATVAALACSLLADALLVVIAQAAMPATKGYEHFQFADYGKLTVIGVLIACVAWPVTTRITSAPQWMFARMAVLVTLVLWLPDVYILMKGQPADAVAVLFVMHVAIALVTYNALVRLSPVRPLARHATRLRGRAGSELDLRKRRSLDAPKRDSRTAECIGVAARSTR
jgi:hypothetical protein